MRIRAMGAGVAAAFLLTRSGPAIGAEPDQRSMVDLKPAATLRLGATADWVQIAGGAVWVGTGGPDSIVRIDPRTNRITARARLPGAVCAGMTSGFGAVWAPLCGRRRGIAQISLLSGRLVRILPMRAGVEEGGIAAGAGGLWAPANARGEFLRIDPATGRIRQTLKLCAGAENPLLAGGSVWVTCSAGASVVRIDPRTGRPLGETPTGPHPRFLAGDDAAVWVLSQGDGTITHIDPETGHPLAVITAGLSGSGGDIQVGARRVWATLAGKPLNLIEPSGNRLVRQWTGPGGDSLNVGFGSVWLTDYHRGLLQRLPLDQLLR